MKTWHWLVSGFVLVTLVVVVGLRLLTDDTTPAHNGAARAWLPPLDSQQLPPAQGLVAAQPPLTGSDSPLPPLPELMVDAADSMKQALEHGDPAAPPVVRTAPGEQPTAAELADPEAYQQYEARQNQRLYNQYVRAANDEIPRLQADIQRARAAGLPPDQIDEGEEKLRLIQAIRDELQADMGAMQAEPAVP